MAGIQKVFLSCVTPQFKACRDALASDLRAIGCEVKVQEDFQQGADTLIAQIEAYVDQCQRVIALVGDAYGCEAAKAAVPNTDPPRSYTQWEYYFALGERLNGSPAASKDRFVYFASQAYLDQHPVAQAAEAKDYQASFKQMLEDSGKHRGEFDSLDQLCRLVLRDGWQIQARPVKPCNLPYDSLGPLFKGREGFMSALHEQLQQNTAQVLAITAKQVIHGLGGVGKTRLAVEYAWRYADEFSALLFINAESPSALQQNLAALCDPKYLNLAEQQAKEQDHRTAAVLRWLAEHAGWLLIMDNIDSPAAASAVEALFSQLQAGQVLLTSRLSEWGGDVQAMPLDVLAESDAVAFILERTQQRRIQQSSDAPEALALVKELGGLALALEQAGAFIAQKRCSISEYLDRWKKRETKVRVWYDERLMHYPSSVAVTWDTSVQQLDAAAFALLQILCWFAPDPIPRALLAASAGEQQLTDCMALLTDKPAEETSQPDLEDALTQLAAYSLVRWEDNNTAFSLHRLVSDITQSCIPEAQRAPWLSAAILWINDYLPDDSPPNDVRFWPLWLPLVSHLSGLLVLADTANISDPTASLAIKLGLFFTKQGNWAEAESLIRRALAIDELSFGEGHHKVARDLNNLAALLQETYRLEEAEPLIRRALAIEEASFGEAHPNFSTVLNNLAALLQATNRLGEAEPLMRRALAIDEASFREGHPNIARDLHNLAYLLQDTNRLAEAEPLIRRALAIDEASFGEAHPNVAISLNNLAKLLKDSNRLAEAKPLIRKSLEIFLQFPVNTGQPHPSLDTVFENYRQILQQLNWTETQINQHVNDIQSPYGFQWGDRVAQQR